MALTLTLNGQTRTLEELSPAATVADLVAQLGLKADRIALELNGEIVGRSRWGATVLADADRLEVVHFVGGGSASPPGARERLRGTSTTGTC